MKNLKLKRKDNEEVFATKELGWKYHHMEVSPQHPIDSELYKYLKSMD